MLKLKETSLAKRRWHKYLLVFLFFWVACPVTWAKEKLTWRKMLNPIHFNLSWGYGMCDFENLVGNMHMIEKDGHFYLVALGTDNTMYWIRWMGEPNVRVKSYDNLQDLVGKAGEKKITLNGRGYVLPITFSGHIDIRKKLRFELGSNLYINQIKILKPDKKHKSLGDYTDPLGKHYIFRPFASLGFKVLENSAYTVLFNTQIGFEWVYANLGAKMASRKSLYPFPASLGLTVEKHIAEYCSFFGKIVYDTHSFLEYLGGKKGNALAKDRKGVLWDQKAIYLQVGITINCPEIPRCPIKSCDVAVKHKHMGRPYRGVSMFTGKDAKGNRLYEK